MSVNFLDHIQHIEDPRVPGMVIYPLDEIMFSVLTGLLCRGEDWEEIEYICETQLEWLKKYLPFENGIAQAQTMQRIFRSINPKSLEKSFSDWVCALQEKITGCSNVKGVVAVDGKTLRGSKKDANGSGALHMLSAYAHEAGLVIGQCAVSEKSNEITAIPVLLDSLSLKNTIVTFDAMGCQKDVSHKVRSKNADYILALKGNQGTLKEDVTLWFKENIKTLPQHKTFSGGHGRIETRTCCITPAEWLSKRHPEWKDLNIIIQVTSERTFKKTGKTSEETRYYISSLAKNTPPEEALKAVRAHWSIENNLHWHLDVTFKEDQSRTRKEHSAQNLSIMRRTILNILRKEKSKTSLKKKRLKAAMDNSFREKLLKC